MIKISKKNSRYAYISCAVAEGLKEFIREKKIVPNKIPPAVVSDAIEFLNCAAEATLPRASINTATANAYCLAVEIIGSIHNKFKSREKINRRLQIYTFLMDRIDFQSSCQLSSRNIQLFQELVKFFEKLNQLGKKEISDSYWKKTFGDSDDD